MSSVECGENNAQEANHGNPSVDQLCVTAEEVIPSSGYALEDWDGCRKREDEECQDDGHWESLELLKDVESSGKLCTQGSKDTKHC